MFNGAHTIASAGVGTVDSSVADPFECYEVHALQPQRGGSMGGRGWGDGARIDGSKVEIIVEE